MSFSVSLCWKLSKMILLLLKVRVCLFFKQKCKIVFQILHTTFGDRSRSVTSYNGYDDLYPRKTSAIVQPMPLHPINITPEKENVPIKPYTFSPVLPGTGTITHNITRMLSETEQNKKEGLPGTATRASRYSPYSTSHFMSYRQKSLQDSSNQKPEGNVFYLCIFHLRFFSH